jgi:hypothetical protein
LDSNIKCFFERSSFLVRQEWLSNFVLSKCQLVKRGGQLNGFYSSHRWLPWGIHLDVEICYSNKMFRTHLYILTLTLILLRKSKELSIINLLLGTQYAYHGSTNHQLSLYATNHIYRTYQFHTATVTMRVNIYKCCEKKTLRHKSYFDC